MKKKEKRKLLDRLEHSIERNKAFCVRNDTDPTEYMEGVNDMAKLMIRFVKKMCKKKKKKKK
jgi:hypothetical protein